MPRKSHLPDDVRRFIVESLACFDTPKTVADAVKKEFRVEISRQAVEAHDPSKVAGVNVAASLREHFHKTRKTFRRELEDIPIANRAVRLRALDRMARRFEEMGNLLGARLFGIKVFLSWVAGLMAMATMMPTRLECKIQSQRIQTMRAIA